MINPKTDSRKRMSLPFGGFVEYSPRDEVLMRDRLRELGVFEDGEYVTYTEDDVPAGGCARWVTQ